MACAPFVWPRQSTLSSTALASWPAPTISSSWSATPSVTLLQSKTSKEDREKCEDLLDNLILQAAEQKSKEDMLASLHETSSKPSLKQQGGARKLLKKQSSPCQRFWNSGYCGYGDACIYRHISQSPTIVDSDQLDEVSVRDERPPSRSSLNPLAKDFTIGQPAGKDFSIGQSLAKDFTMSQPMAKDFIIGQPPKLWAPPVPDLVGKDAACPTYPSLPFIPSTFSSPPPSPSLNIETLAVNMNISLPPPMPKKSFYSTFTPVNSNPSMVSQFEGMMRDWGSLAGRATFN